MDQIRPRPKIIEGLLVRARVRVIKQMDEAIKKHGNGAFANSEEIEAQIRKQLAQLDKAFCDGDLEGAKKQLAQIGQLAVFGLASMETWNL